MIYYIFRTPGQLWHRFLKRHFTGSGFIPDTFKIQKSAVKLVFSVIVSVQNMITIVQL